MSEERFDRLEQQIRGLGASTDRRFETIEGQIRDLQTSQKEWRGDLESRLRELSTDLGRQLRMFHEDVISRIAATQEYSGVTRQEFGEYKESIEQRVRPLEVLSSVVREHDATLRRHDAEITSLKRKRR